MPFYIHWGDHFNCFLPSLPYCTSDINIHSISLFRSLPFYTEFQSYRSIPTHHSPFYKQTTTLGVYLPLGTSFLGLFCFRFWLLALSQLIVSIPLISNNFTHILILLNYSHISSHDQCTSVCSHIFTLVSTLHCTSFSSYHIVYIHISTSSHSWFSLFQPWSLISIASSFQVK